MNTASPSSSRIKVVFAPDWQQGVPYQTLLQNALEKHGVEVVYLRNYRRGLPLSRGLRGLAADLLHLHWPEAYYPPMEDGLDWFRRFRFPLDLVLALRQMPMVMTAHNALPHNRRGESFIFRNSRASYRRAQRIFIHSALAGEELKRLFGIGDAELILLPPNDLASSFAPLLPKGEARRQLGLPEAEPLCLMFGVISAYKGVEEVIGWWRKARPGVRLAIVGSGNPESYGREIAAQAADVPEVAAVVGWLSEPELRLWLSAADCTLFNYRHVLNSGSAPVARALGIPVLIPERLASVDLGDPHSHVLRFAGLNDSFGRLLQAAVRLPRDDAGAEAWRQRASWSEIGRLTADAYRGVLATASSCAA